MTWKLTFTLIVIIGGILTGLAPLFLFTDFRAELEVGICSSVFLPVLLFC